MYRSLLVGLLTQNLDTVSFLINNNCSCGYYDSVGEGESGKSRRVFLKTIQNPTQYVVSYHDKHIISIYYQALTIYPEGNVVCV